ncbi:hypothetical protein B1H26_39875 [Amycolatopsis sp. BJA-103]|nr:hypothetical protein B1H26_39875 [Amycolatopsis sp. BJA-103]
MKITSVAATVAELSRLPDRQGAGAVKMNGTEKLSYLDTWDKVDRRVANVDAVRQAVGPNVGIGVDFHGRVHKPMAKVLLRELEPYRLMFVEEPVLSEHIDGFAEVLRNSPIPIALAACLQIDAGCYNATIRNRASASTTTRVTISSTTSPTRRCSRTKADRSRSPAGRDSVSRSTKSTSPNARRRETAGGIRCGGTPTARSRSGERDDAFRPLRTHGPAVPLEPVDHDRRDPVLRLPRRQGRAGRRDYAG